MAIIGLPMIDVIFVTILPSGNSTFTREAIPIKITGSKAVRILVAVLGIS